MTPSPGSPETGADSATAASVQASASTVTVADAIASVVLAVPGVARLHAGSFGEVATYLPGRRVVGVRTSHEMTEVHVVVRASEPVLGIAERVRAAVLPLVSTPVDVYLEDLDSFVPESTSPATAVPALPPNGSHS